MADLATRLTDPAIREEASALLRRLIDKVVVHQGDAGQEIELHGSILSLVNLGNPAEVTERSLSSVKLVAGGRIPALSNSVGCAGHAVTVRIPSLPPPDSAKLFSTAKSDGIFSLF